MGMYDSIMVNCPTCDKLTEIHSKADRCNLAVYTLNTAPAKVLLDICEESHFCPNNHSFYLRVQSIVHADAIVGKLPNADEDADEEDEVSKRNVTDFITLLNED